MGTWLLHIPFILPGNHLSTDAELNAIGNDEFLCSGNGELLERR
jgi:hypothetical protein